MKDMSQFVDSNNTRPREYADWPQIPVARLRDENCRTFKPTRS